MTLQILRRPALNVVSTPASPEQAALQRGKLARTLADVAVAIASRAAAEQGRGAA